MSGSVVVIGNVNVAGDVNIVESFVTPVELEPTPKEPASDLEIVTVDTLGKLIASRPIFVTFQPPDQPVPFDTVAFAVTCPFADDAVRAELRNDGRLLATIAGESPLPSISDVHVSETTTEDGRPARKIEWSASSSTSLVFTVSYSVDSGRSFTPWRTGVSETNCTVALDGVAGAPNALVKVTASDGFHLVEAVSDPISLPRSAPVAAILWPRAGIGLSGTELRLRGVALDPEDGLLSSASLQWHLITATEETPLGTGLDLAVKSPPEGDYVVRLVATDSDGMQGTAEAVITIGAGGGPA